MNHDSSPSYSWHSECDQLVSSLESRIIEIRRHLHANPEISGKETETSNYLARQLQFAGLETRLCKNGVGVVADLEIGEPDEATPLVAIRCDIDALRLEDQKNVEYRSCNAGVTHACGHDAHSAIALGAALVASQLSDSAIEGTCVRLRFIFQPAEETCEGARWMVEQGAMDGVSAIVALHVDPERLVGKVGMRYGVLTANCDEVDIVVDGQGGHAARPHQSIDPVATAAHLISALYQSLPRAVDSRQPSVFTIGKIAGGFAPNVIPQCVELRGSLRTVDRDDRRTLKQRIQQIIAGVGQISGTTIQLKFLSPLPSVVNDPRVTAVLETAAREVVGPSNIDLIDLPSMGGEDFAYYLDHAPGAMLRLGCAADPHAPYLHSPDFDIDERALAIGTRIMIRAAISLSTDLCSDSEVESTEVS